MAAKLSRALQGGRTLCAPTEFGAVGAHSVRPYRTETDKKIGHHPMGYHAILV